MKTIWKYLLDPKEGMAQIRLQMPEGAHMLSVQMQLQNEAMGGGFVGHVVGGSYPTLWALVDPEKPLEQRVVEVYGTGHRMPDEIGRFIGTFQFPLERLVFHVFEGVERKEDRK